MIKLNERILEEAYDREHPLLERIKFLAICGSGLDELFMVRVSGLKRQALKGALKAPPDGTYERIIPGPDDERIDSQKWLIEHRGIWHGDA